MPIVMVVVMLTMRSMGCSELTPSEDKWFTCDMHMHSPNSSKFCSRQEGGRGGREGGRENEKTFVVTKSVHYCHEVLYTLDVWYRCCTLGVRMKTNWKVGAPTPLSMVT